MVPRFRWWMALVAAGLGLVALFQLRPAPALAQCGTQASSCKNCHEVQAQHPVNSKGVWHTDHAFGDFCEFCHAGNVQATDKTAAHQGMVAWNADVKASCVSCHAADYDKRAQTYATTLGVGLNTGASAGGAASEGAASEGAAAKGGASTGAATATSSTAACAPQGGEQIDFNLLYAERFAPPPLVSNWGNLILAVLSFGVGIVFVGTVWTWEGWGRKAARWIRNNVTPVTEAVQDVSQPAGGKVDDASDGEPQR